jgi:hypothetical protein
MLYTERAHFYRRQTIRGIRDVYFYSLPDREQCVPDYRLGLESPEQREKAGPRQQQDWILKRLQGG